MRKEETDPDELKYVFATYGLIEITTELSLDSETYKRDDVVVVISGILKTIHKDPKFLTELIEDAKKQAEVYEILQQS